MVLSPKVHPIGAAAALDASALTRLSELDPTGKSRLLERVLTVYQGSLNRLLPQLQMARRDRDAVAIERVAHTLKSSSATIGALHFAALCAETEAIARSACQDDLDAHVASMLEEVPIVLKTIAKLLDSMQ